MTAIFSGTPGPSLTNYASALFAETAKPVAVSSSKSAGSRTVGMCINGVSLGGIVGVLVFIFSL